jgi:hypothetical protein
MEAARSCETDINIPEGTQYKASMRNGTLISNDQELVSG